MTLGARFPIDDEPVRVRVDHPFLLTIRHCYSGELLFLGRIANPVDGTA